MTRIYISILAVLFSVSLFAQTKTFAGADYSQGIVFVMENNRIVWKHKAPDSNDLWGCVKTKAHPLLFLI